MAKAKKTASLADKLAGAIMTDDPNIIMAATAKAKSVRDNIKPGTYIIDHPVRVKGHLVVGEDYIGKSVQALNPWLLLRLAMSKLNNTTIDALVDEFKKLQEMKQEDFMAESVASEEVKKKVELACKSLLKETEGECSGKVTWHGIVEVDMEELEPAVEQEAEVSAIVR